MGNLIDTENAYFGSDEVINNPEEKVIHECNRMGLAQALIYMHRQRIYLPDESEFARALDEILLFFDEMWMLHRTVGSDNEVKV